jgi:ADP-ribose pyrophosphatase YjhB (NUDIX family)
MNYNIYINNNNNIKEDDKIIILKKNYYCTNCNKKGHTYKKCNNPIISNGIICINLSMDKTIDDTFNKNLEDYINKHFNSKIYSNIVIDKTKINRNIKFLLIQRKNSLGYLEFMRGRYDENNNENITYLFEQMTQVEIDDIIKKDFDLLWTELWDENNIRNKNHHKEYTVSKQKFYELRLNKLNYINQIKPIFNFNEWGFPKGRREPYESDLVCAVREFEEETNLKENDYTILENCKKIKENLVGTNGINYLHNYFLALLSNSHCRDIEECNNKGSSREIGDIKYLDYDECISLIRPYHLNKIKIINVIYTLINEYLLSLIFQ